LGKWLRTAELEGTTRKSYSSYIERTIKPAPGEIVLPKVDAPTFGILYTEVRLRAGQ
jgi:integrase